MAMAAAKAKAVASRQNQRWPSLAVVARAVASVAAVAATGSAVRAVRAAEAVTAVAMAVEAAVETAAHSIGRPPRHQIAGRTHHSCSDRPALECSQVGSTRACHPVVRSSRAHRQRTGWKRKSSRVETVAALVEAALAETLAEVLGAK